MSGFELWDAQSGFSLPQPNDEFYEGTYLRLQQCDTSSWSDAETSRGYYLDWLATQYAFQMFPESLNAMPGIRVEQMRLHEAVYVWYAEHPTDREIANATK